MCFYAEIHSCSIEIYFQPTAIACAAFIHLMLITYCCKSVLPRNSISEKYLHRKTSGQIRGF